MSIVRPCVFIVVFLFGWIGSAAAPCAQRGRLDFSHDRIHIGRREREHGNFRALGCEQLGGGAANAATSACDDGDLISLPAS